VGRIPLHTPRSAIANGLENKKYVEEIYSTQVRTERGELRRSKQRWLLKISKRSLKGLADLLTSEFQALCIYVSDNQRMGTRRSSRGKSHKANRTSAANKSRSAKTDIRPIDSMQNDTERFQ
jgi:hypothetical protein